MTSPRGVRLVAVGPETVLGVREEERRGSASRGLASHANVTAALFRAENAICALETAQPRWNGVSGWLRPQLWFRASASAWRRKVPTPAAPCMNPVCAIRLSGWVRFSA